MRRAIIGVQSSGRALIQRKRFESWTSVRHDSATLLQTVLKGHRIRLQMKTHSDFIVHLQALARRFTVQKEKKAILCAVTRVQRAYRKRSVERSQFVYHVQCIIRGALVRFCKAKASAAAAHIQASWKGFCVRKKAVGRIVSIRHRLQKANSQFNSSMTLASRTKNALEILSSSSALSNVLKACQHLGMWRTL